MTVRYNYGRDMSPCKTKIPTVGTLKCIGHDYRAKGVPARDQAIYAALRDQYRAGAIYAFSHAPETGDWTTWTTEADWLATERNGQVRRPDLVELGHGPCDRSRDDMAAVLGLDAPRAAKLTKAQLVAQLRQVPDLPVAALEMLALA